MSGALEAHVTMCVADYLRLRGAWSFRPLGHLGQLPGIPDFVGCWRGRFLAVELYPPTWRRVLDVLAGQEGQDGS